MKKTFFAFLFTFSLLLPAAGAADNWSITDGMGEELEVKHSLFGKKVKSAKDRYGNSFKSEDGLLSSGRTSLTLLGNRLEKKNGLLSGSKLEASTIFGDKVKSKKGLFGRRKTELDLSGSAALISSFFGKKKTLEADPLLFNGNALNEAVPGNSP